MKISYKWLVELTGLDWPPEEMGERLTLCGTACEYIEPTDRFMDKVVVGEVTALEAIPKADKIKKATVDIGSEKYELVCGAPNVAVGQKVPVALIGACLAGDITIKKAKIRGVESVGMICSERELDISDDHSGIMVLDNDAPLGKPLADYLDYHDNMLTFELTPNRSDSMSAIGIARDLAALASIKVKKPGFDLKESSRKASEFIKVKIDDPEGCPRYAARVIKNIKIAPSPWWVKKKLLTAGMRPISNVVDITNLVMLETGHPLHAFDLKRFGSDEVVVRKATDKEKFVTLDGEEHELTPEVLLITNGHQGVAAGGVMGGLDSEVTEDTADIILEAAYFNPSVIRKSRKKLGLVTESSSRFEKGTDPNGIPYAINRAAYLFQELCGGEVLEGIVDNYPNEIKPVTISFRPSRCNYVLGAKIPRAEMKKIFNDLEFKVAGDDNAFEVTVPTFRPDIEREIDLTEEVARIYGYDNIPDAVTNIGPLYTPYHKDDTFRDEIVTILSGLGFDEMLNHGLVNSKLASMINPSLPAVKIINPVSEELDIMRNSMVPSALHVIEHNLSHRNMDLNLFEIGKIYFPPDKEGDWVEEERLILATSGNTVNDWREKPRPLDFYDLKTAVEHLSKHFNWPLLKYEPEKVNCLDKEISFKIMLENTKVGEIGRISGKILDKIGIKQPVFIADLSLMLLFKLSNRQIVFEQLPVYPSAPRDLSIVVDELIRAGDIIVKMKETAGELARSVDIFDLYTGKQIEKGKKSIAISINYRSDEGNLSSEVVEELQQKVIEMLKKDFNADIRDS